MSNYHNQMINIQMPEDKYNLDEQPDMTDVMAYKFGHRDARHAAAEIAIEADRRIVELEAKLAAANQRIEELGAECCDRFFEDLANNMPDEFGD